VKHGSSFFGRRPTLTPVSIFWPTLKPRSDAQETKNQTAEASALRAFSG